MNEQAAALAVLSSSWPGRAHRLTYSCGRDSPDSA